jgi:hypothetical protein
MSLGGKGKTKKQSLTNPLTQKMKPEISRYLEIQKFLAHPWNFGSVFLKSLLQTGSIITNNENSMAPGKMPQIL